MSKKPNAVGRIEAEPKVKWRKTKKAWSLLPALTLYVVLPVVLIALGVAGTLKYQSFISGTKADGVAEYKLSHCNKYADEKKGITWLECDE